MIPGLTCYYELEKFGGKKGWKSRKYRSRSFVKGFMWGLYKMMGGTASISTLNILGNSVTVSPSGYGTYVNGLGGKFKRTGTTDTAALLTWDRIGIVVGTGTDAVLTTNHQLQTPVLAGRESGRLEHGGHFFPADVTVSAPDCTFYFERIFRNFSGGAIVIGEVGINSYMSGGNGINWYVDPGSQIFQIVRDKLAATVNVADGEYLKVGYTIKITV